MDITRAREIVAGSGPGRGPTCVPYEAARLLADELDSRPRLVHLVTRATPDGMYLFDDADQAQAYAALFPGATTRPATVIDRAQADQLIERERAELAAAGDEEEAAALVAPPGRGVPGLRRDYLRGASGPGGQS